MSISNYNKIKQQENFIEEKRLAIKEKKKEISKMHNKIDTISNVYEYLVTPICAMSIALVVLLQGPIVYVLPSLAAIGAAGVITYKFILKNKLELLEKVLSKLKDQRQDAYKDREALFENIFDNLNKRHMDYKGFYSKLVEASEKCDLLTEYMVPYKEKRKRLQKIRNVISGIFDYLLAPLGAVAIPLLCSFVDIGTIGELILMGLSSGSLLSCSLIDNSLTKKIDDLNDEISDIKSDRTILSIFFDSDIYKFCDIIEYHISLIK